MRHAPAQEAMAPGRCLEHLSRLRDNARLLTAIEGVDNKLGQACRESRRLCLSPSRVLPRPPTEARGGERAIVDEQKILK